MVAEVGEKIRKWLGGYDRQPQGPLSVDLGHLIGGNLIGRTSYIKTISV